MDFIVKLPKSAGCDSILVVVDRFSKMCPLCRDTLKKSTLQVLLKLILDNVCQTSWSTWSNRFRPGLNSSASFGRSFGVIWGVALVWVQLFHPRKPMVKLRLRTKALEQYAGCFVNFARMIGLIIFLSRSLPWIILYLVPLVILRFFINYGFHIVSTCSPKTDVKVEKDRGLVRRTDYYSIWYLVGFLEKSRETRRNSRTTNVVILSFKVGDLVWLSTENLKTSRPCKKLEFRHVGPFEVLEKRSDISYVESCQIPWRFIQVFHVSLFVAGKKSDVDTDVVEVTNSYCRGPLSICSQRHFGFKKGRWHYWIFGQLEMLGSYVETSGNPLPMFQLLEKMVQGTIVPSQGPSLRQAKDFPPWVKGCASVRVLNRGCNVRICRQDFLNILWYLIPGN